MTNRNRLILAAFFALGALIMSVEFVRGDSLAVDFMLITPTQTVDGAPITATTDSIEIALAGIWPSTPPDSAVLRFDWVAPGDTIRFELLRAPGIHELTIRATTLSRFMQQLNEETGEWEDTTLVPTSGPASRFRIFLGQSVGAPPGKVQLGVNGLLIIRPIVTQ